MTDTERAACAQTEHRVMCSLGARLAAGEILAPAEFDEYLDMSVLGVPAVAARLGRLSEMPTNATIADAQRVIDRIEHVTEGRFRSFRITATLFDPVRDLTFSRVDDAEAYYLGVLSVLGENEIRKGPFSERYDHLSDYHFTGTYQAGINAANEWYR